MTRTGGQQAKRSAATSGKRARRRRPPTPRGRWGRALVAGGKIGAVVGFAALIVGGLFFVRLLQGPISLGFLVQPIERAISEEFAGVVVRVESAAVRLGDGGHLEFELTNVRVSDADDVPLALAPSASVALSRRALLSGRIAPESVDLISPRLSLFYSEDGALSLKFAHPAEASEGESSKALPLRGTSVPLPTPPGGQQAADNVLGRIDLIKMLSEASGRARRREHAGAYLREIGLRSATVIIDNGTRKSVWRVPELNVDLDHRRSRSSIAGRIKVDSMTGPWTLNFRTYEHENAKALLLDISLQELVPRGLARALPQLAGLESIDVPVWGDAHLEIANNGEILGGTISIDAAPGHVRLPWLAATPLRIDGGHLSMSYSRETRRFEVAPSVVVWGDSRLQFTGSIAHTPQSPNGAGWAFEFKSAGGWLGAEPPLLQRLSIDDWSARGLLAPDQGRIVLSQFVLRAGGAEVSAQGDVADMAGAMKARLEGKIGAMPASVFKTLWPTAIAPHAREWVVKRLVRGWLQGGAFKLASGGDAGDGVDSGSLTLEGSNLAFTLVDGLPVLDAQRALLRLDAQTLELTIPDATLAAADGRRLSFKGGLTVDMKEPLPRTGRIAVRMQGPLGAALELLDGEPINMLRTSGLSASGVEGKIDGQATISLPLGQPIEPRDLKIDGKARISEGRLRQAFGPYDVTGANIAIDMTGSGVEAKGEMLINGVLAKTRWQHVFGAPPERQPAARITATLDNSDRTQLGLDINDLVQGEVGMEVTLHHSAQGERQVHVRADLVNAEVMIESVAWRKPKGRPSVFEFDVIRPGAEYPIELHDVKMVGDNVAIAGWMGIGPDPKAIGPAPDNKVKEFRFPQFSLNVVTSLVASGKMRPDGVWDVTAKGPIYDARDMFRSFFDVEHMGDPSGKVRPGLDLKAEVDTVVGHSDTTLRNVVMKLQKRLNKLTSLDVRGVLEGGKPFAAVLRHEPGQPRRLQAESMDAGQTFKLVGFYPNAVGGQMNLEVNLDGAGAAQRTGTLWTRDFVVLGDPVLSEVMQTSDGTQQANARRTVLRQQFDFDILRVPFSVGHGQFVMHNGSINGPIVSASIRGKVDFRSQALDVGGTYVPMSGLMRVPAPIPLIGPLLTGPRGEGLFGITYGIQGSMAKPQVMVNPFSLVTPGILREIFQMTPEDPKVLPRERQNTRGEGVRASSAPAASAPESSLASPGPAPDVGGSWSADTTQPPARKRSAPAQ